MGNTTQNSNSKNQAKSLLNILWYILLFPIAITVYVAKSKKLNNISKAIIIIIMWIFFLALASSNNSSNKKDEVETPNTSQNQTIGENNKSENIPDNNQISNGDNKTIDPLNLSLGNTYNDNGVKVTIESLEKDGDLNKFKVKIENSSSENYSFNMLLFWLWTMDGSGISYASGKNSDDALVGKDIKPGEKFESYIFAESGDVSYITYSLISRNHKLSPTAKWIIKKDTRTQAEKDAESKNASNKAQESFKNLMPYPAEVKFPLLDYAVERVSGGFYQYGNLKYKNKYGNQVKGAYRMWYDTDGTLTKAELDNKTLK